MDMTSRRVDSRHTKEKEYIMNLLELLLGSLQQNASVSNVSEKTGGSNEQIMKLIKLALPILILYMTRNANSQQGARSLLDALGDHQDTGNIADQIANADLEDGDKIIGHILGDDKKSVISDLAGQTGMDYSQVVSALGSMAPGILSGLSAATTSADKKKKNGVDLSDGIDLGDIMGLLGGTASQSSSSGGLGDLLGGLFGGGQKPAASATNGMDLINTLVSLL